MLEFIYSLSLQAFLWVQQCLVTFYAQNLRQGLFAGFLSMGALIFSLKNAIVFNLHRDLYSTDAYSKRWKELSNFNRDLTRYGPLKRLNDLLLTTVVLSFATAVAQFSIGLVPWWPFSLLALVLAVATIAYLLRTIHVYWKNMRVWFRFLEEKHN